MSLRFIERDGKIILQTLILESSVYDQIWGRTYGRKYKWVDVPLVAETEHINEPDPLIGGA
jgi:hypothetical protein